MLEENIKKSRNWIEKSDAVLITAGAGMGVDSGLPDFRGQKGFWRAYPLLKKLNLNFEEMANPIWFEENPKLAWAFYGHRLNLYRNTKPHDGFKMLLKLCKKKNNNYFIFTSNVDGQFQKSGFNGEKIYEVHGSIHYLQCIEDCSYEIWNTDGVEVEVDMEKFEAKNIPTCPICSAVARPNILMFWDWSWNRKRADEQKKKYKNFLQQNSKKRIAIIEIGAGRAIPTVRIEGEELAKYNALLIRINPYDYQIDPNLGFSIPLGGLEGIKRILEGLI